MSTFDVALRALQKDRRVINKTCLNKELYLSATKKKIVFDTEEYGQVPWVPNQGELLSNDWAIVAPTIKGQ